MKDNFGSDVKFNDLVSNEKPFYKPETELEDKIQQTIEQFEDTLRDSVKNNNIKAIYDVRFKIEILPLIKIDSYNKEERESE
jgi:predicted component of type VI protein secretion system